MDKARRPHVIRTWTVERTKVPYRNPQLLNLHPEPRPGSFRSAVKTAKPKAAPVARPPEGVKE